MFNRNELILPNLYGHGDCKVDKLSELLPWYIDPKKLEFEKQAIRECYDDQFQFKTDKYCELYIEGIINTPSLSTLIWIKYPPYYPLYWPKVYPIPARMFSPHMYHDFSMCLFYPSDSIEHSWNPFIDTTNDIIKMAFEWVFKQGYWEITGKWPGREAPHGGSGTPIYLKSLFKSFKKWKRKNGKKNRSKLQKS